MKNTYRPVLVALFFFWLGLSGVLAGDSKVSIRFSEPFEMPKKHWDDAFIGDAKRGYLEISHCAEKSMSFQKFDANLKMVAQNIVSIQDIPKDYYRFGYRDVGSHTYWFYTCWNKAERKQELFARKIDFEKAGFDGAVQSIVKADKLEITYDLTQSADKKLLLVHYALVERDRGSNMGQLHGFVVLDENMNKVSSVEYDLPLYSYHSCYVDRAANIYCMASIYERPVEGSSISYHRGVLIWEKNSKQPIKIQIITDGKFVDKPMLAEDLNGNVLVAGYYANLNGDRGADGLFMGRLNRETGTLDKMLKGIYNFPREISYSTELEKKEATGRRPTTTLKKLVFSEDGTIQAYGEVTAEGPDWNWTIVSDNKPYTQGVQGYYNLDIIAMNIAKDGEIIWLNRIDKRQKINGAFYETGTDYGNGFNSFSYGENKFFLFSDNPDNANLAAGEKLKFSKEGAKGVLMAVKVDASGKISKQLVYNANDDKTFLDVHELHVAGPNQMIATSSTGMTLRVALLTFE